MGRILASLLIGSVSAFTVAAQAQAPPFVIDTVAGYFDLGDGGPADEALVASPQGLARDGAGSIYIADRLHYRIRKITQGGQISTVAGIGTSDFSGDGGPATDAALSLPFDVDVDAQGNLYIADTSSNRIRRVDAATGVITTVAGGGDALGDGGPATEAQLFFCRGVAVGNDGSFYIADSLNHRVRMVNPQGVISTISGTGTAGFAGDNGAANLAQLSFPSDVDIAPVGSPIAGAILIADMNNQRVRIIRNGMISTLAGNGTAGFSGDGGQAAAAQLSGPSAVSADAAGNVFLSDTNNLRVRRVAPGGVITTVAGGAFGFGGDGGPAAAALMDFPSGVFADAAGLLISDTENHRVRSVVNGTINSIAGRNRATGDGGPALEAEMFFPFGLDVDTDNNLIITDFRNHRMRKVTFASPGTMSTVAGSAARGSAGDGGPATQATLNFPNDGSVDSQGNIHIVETPSHRVRRVNPAGVISTLAGTGVGGFSGDDGPANAAQVSNPAGIAEDSQGRVYIADSGNHRIRRVDLNGTIRTIAGTGTAGFSGDGGQATSAQLNAPARIYVDSEGYVFFSSLVNRRIRVIAPDGIIRTVVGTGENGFNGDGLPALETSLTSPSDIVVDANRNLFFTDGPARIRMTPLSAAVALGGGAEQVTAGNVFTVAGMGESGFSGDRGLATQATMRGPFGLGVDSVGRVYFSDSANHRIRVLDPTLPLVTTEGVTNGASFTNMLSPGVIATAFVLNGAQQDDMATAVPLPTNLGGVVLEIEDSQGVTRQCGIFGIFGNQRQINFYIDPETALGPATLTLRRADGETSSAAIEIQQVATGVFSFTNAQSQPVALANYLHFRGQEFTVQNTFTLPEFGLAPIDLGAEGDQVYISLFMTGIQFASGVENMSATLGGEAVPVFSFVGALEQFVGLGQANIGPIPRSFIGRGPVTLLFTADGVTANGVMVSFQ